MNFIKELKWRGMIHDIMPGTEEKLAKEMCVAYVGYDPTAPSLHIGNLVTIMMLVHFQLNGHKPIALVGGATGMIGDPSGRSEERRLLPIEKIRFNQERIRFQLEKFLEFGKKKNAAEIVNNYDWFENVQFLEFLRNVGKHLTINYMLAKDSVKQRLEKGISFTEFAYQLLQAYDFYWLYKNKNCTLQMGGSDQWGNITAGTELIRRKDGEEAFALTCPLITKSDGSKFGKSEGRNVWLEPEMTSPYKFYQYWMNCSDRDAAQFIKIFTLLSKDEINTLINEHKVVPQKRHLQKTLAKDITTRVHSESDYKKAVEISKILFGKVTTVRLRQFSEKDLLTAFEGVPQVEIAKSEIQKGLAISDLLGVKTNIFSSKSEVKRMIQQGGISINKSRIHNTDMTVTADQLLNGKFILLQKGKKNYHLILAK